MNGGIRGLRDIGEPSILCVGVLSPVRDESESSDIVVAGVNISVPSFDVLLPLESLRSSLVVAVRRPLSCAFPVVRRCVMALCGTMAEC